MTETRPQATQTDASTNPLDQVWEYVNAIGGSPTNEYERGMNDAVGKALEVIERFGGMNPDVRRASPNVQRMYQKIREQWKLAPSEN